jgi:hypothetical protein
MSFQIKRSNKSVVVVKRWYVNGVQKEKHIMTIEPYTTPEQLHALQSEFRESKGKMPKKTYKEQKDKMVRLSDEDIEKIEDSLRVTKKYQHLKTEKQKHKDITERITGTPTKTVSKMSERAAVMKYGSEELKRKRGYIK